MPPASGRRGRTRKEAEVLRSDADTPDSVNTPSRKRRRVNGADSTAPTSAPSRPISASQRRESVETDETIENSENDPLTEEEKQRNLADEVIRHLKVASYDINAATDYHNSIVDKEVQAFAKIAGRTWTYYVSQLSVVIGRPNHKQKRVSDGSTTTGGSGRLLLDDMKIDIDLGPDMQVSRMHAQIIFDQNEEKWFIDVNGRNGLHVDNTRLESGAKAWLHSGMVISILGTQMMFLLPNASPVVHPDIQRLALTEEEENTDPEQSQDHPTRPYSGRGARGRAPNNQGAHPRSSGGHTVTGDGQPSYAPQKQPGTPVGKSVVVSQPKSKQSPAYAARGILMESTEEIDYSADSAKDLKPPHSYAAMIGQAILSTPEENATLAKIYEYIKEHYAYFRFNGGGWQNSIRHNLSLSKSFEKIPRRTDEPGKGMKWQIVPEHRDEFMKKNIQPTRKIRHVTSSIPNSPANSQNPAAQTERLLGAIGQPESNKRKRSRSATPPLAGFPTAAESYTPDRGPQTSFLQTGNLPRPNASNNLDSANSEGLTPTYDRTSHQFAAPGAPAGHASTSTTEGLRSTAFNSPPTLTSTPYDGPGNLFTPLVPRDKPQSAIPQSTCKAPSFYAKELFSSPAPFWKYIDIGSTPAKLPDLSPSKPIREEDVDPDSSKEGSIAEGDEEKQQIGTPERKLDRPQPSSPPALDPGAHSSPHDPDSSPTRTVSRPVSRSIQSMPDPVTTPSKLPAGAVQRAESPVSVEYPQVPPIRPMVPTAPLGPKMNPYYPGVPGEVIDDDDGSIDLTAGFEKIGSFHRSIANALSR